MAVLGAEGDDFSDHRRIGQIRGLDDHAFALPATAAQDDHWCVGTDLAGLEADFEVSRRVAVGHARVAETVANRLF